jgi:hypothetical protein
MSKKTSKEWYDLDIDHDITRPTGWVEYAKSLDLHIEENETPEERAKEVWLTLPITFKLYEELKSRSSMELFGSNEHRSPIELEEDGCVIL